MFAVLLATSIDLHQLSSSHYCPEVIAVLNDAVKRGSLKQRDADKIIENCRIVERSFDG